MNSLDRLDLPKFLIISFYFKEKEADEQKSAGNTGEIEVIGGRITI